MMQAFVLPLLFMAAMLVAGCTVLGGETRKGWIVLATAALCAAGAVVAWVWP